MGYKIIVKKKAEKEIDKLDRKTRVLIVAFIESLGKCKNPREFKDAKMLKGIPGGMRWRIGKYRILGTVEDEILTIEIFKVGPRSNVYRGL